MLGGKQEAQVFVVKPLADSAEPRAFLSPKAATEFAEYGAYSEFGAEVSEIHWSKASAAQMKRLRP
jgi:hypothetical protein